jgi:hypothetical protein
MSIHRTITLLTVPLFLLLAIVNGGLLYRQEKAEMAEALADQALAAAVTSAEFIAAMDRPREELHEPVRAGALKLAAKNIPGLDGLYFVAAGAPPQALVPSARPWPLAGVTRPAKPRILPVGSDPAGRRYIAALAPAGDRGFVAARIDAEPMFTRIASIQKAVLLIVLLAGLTASALAWFVARRITRELEANHRAIAAIGAGEAPGDGGNLTIREARDLADAVRLMDASREAAAERNRRVTARRDRERTLDSALAASRAAHFAPIAKHAAGARIAMRICGETPPGSFFALATADDRGLLVLGRCAASTAREAFTRAADARRFIESKAFAMPAEACLAEAKRRYAIEASLFTAWSANEPPPELHLLALANGETRTRAERFAANNRDAEPGELLDAIELLLTPDGIFAAISR